MDEQTYYTNEINKIPVGAKLIQRNIEVHGEGYDELLVPVLVFKKGNSLFIFHAIGDAEGNYSAHFEVETRGVSEV